MNGQAKTMGRGGKSSQGAFPEKANPNRPCSRDGAVVAGDPGRGPALPRVVQSPSLPQPDDRGAARARDPVHADGADPGPPGDGSIDVPRRAGGRGVRGAGRRRTDVRPGPGRELRGLCPAPDRRGAAGLPPLPVPRRLEGRRSRVAGLPAAEYAPTTSMAGCSARRPTPPEDATSRRIEAVDSVIRLLPRSHAVACRLIYIEGKSQDEAAEVLGCSKGYLSRLHSDAIARLAPQPPRGARRLSREGRGPGIASRRTGVPARIGIATGRSTQRHETQRIWKSSRIIQIASRRMVVDRLSNSGASSSIS